MEQVESLFPFIPSPKSHFSGKVTILSPHQDSEALIDLQTDFPLIFWQL